jgi:hypothetical protein
VVCGEPIVSSTTDAVECFLHTDIDVLVLEEFVVVRSDQSIESLRPKKSSAKSDD